MNIQNKYKVGHHRRYEVTVGIVDVGVIKHVVTMPENEDQTLHDAALEKLKRAYPNRIVTILRLIERRG